MTIQHPNWLKKHPMIVFLVLSNSITWLCWIPTLLIANQRGYLLPTIANFAKLAQSGFSDPQHIVISVIFSMAVYGPLIAALVATLLETGKDGLVELLSRIIKWRVSVRWYATVGLIVLALSVIPVGMGALVGMVKLNRVALASSVSYFLPMLLVQLLTSGLGEEPGWRGYLLPKLQTRFTVEQAIWRVGLIWAVWHYPFTIYYTLSGMIDMPVAGMVFTIIMSLAGQTVSLIGMTYIYAWLYHNTKSVFVAILFHALGNVMTTVFSTDIQPLVSLMIAVMPWVIVFVLEKVYGKTRFPGQPT